MKKNLVWNHTCDFKSNSLYALVRFWNHAYDFRPNCTPLSSITVPFVMRWKNRDQSVLVPRAHDHSDLQQGSRALAGTDFLSMRRVFVSCPQPIRFAGFDRKSVNRWLPVLYKARALDPCRRSEGWWLWDENGTDPRRWPKGSRPLGTRLSCHLPTNNGLLMHSTV